MHDWVKIEDDTLDFRVPSFKRTVNDPLAAAIEAVNDIVKKNPAPYNLLASGGIDSQAMIYAWKQSKQPFNIHTFCYNQTYNLHDIDTLKTFCEQQQLEYNIIDFDYFTFLETEHDVIAKKYLCSSPQITMHIKMASLLQGTRIYAGNFLTISSATLSYAILGLYRFSITPEGKNVIPYFFLYSPEIAYGFRHIPGADHSITDEYQKRTNQYHLAGFPVIPQDRKYNGFEKFKEFYDSHEHVLLDISNRLKYHNKKNNRPFDWMFRFPYEDMFNEKQLKYLLNPYAENLIYS